ncbi:MAG: tetratricopeptide repeat protein [Gemmataceae bacterium]
MPESIQEAIRHHQAGRLDQAELIYRRLLDEEPNHADALHLLGIVAHQRGQHQKAAQLMSRAVAIRPHVATFHYNLAEAYRMAGNQAKAVEHGQTAVRLQPNSPAAHNNLGLALHAAGRREEAARHFQQAVQLRPNFALAFNNLSNVLREQGRNDEAIAALRECLRLQPNLPHAHCNLGQMLLERGDTEEALHHCQEAIRLRPNFPEAQNNLGNVLRELKRLEEAKNCYARAMHLNPKLAMAYNNMGQALQEEGQLDEAIQWYQKGLQLEPRMARIHCNLASALNAKERPQEAIARYRLAMQLQPDYAEAYNGLGFVLQEQGETQEAVKLYREALRLKPDFAAAYVNLGQALEELGELEEAEQCFRAALGHDPKHAGAYGCLATMLRDQLPEADVAMMEQLLSEDRLADGQRSALHHGLAQVRDAQGQYTSAAEHIRQGNRHHWETLVRYKQTYHPNEHTKFVDHLIEGFSQTFFAKVQGWGLESEVPVFIIGMPRSGTTLLEQVLASHPRMHGAGELRYARDAYESLPNVVGVSLPPSSCIHQLTPEHLRQLARPYLERLLRLNNAADRIVDKMPDNYLYAGLIAALFPKARLIHSRRDVRDIAVSCWITNFKTIRWACDLEHIAARIRDYQRLMDHWRQVLPIPMLDIDYEETVNDLEGVARQMVDWVGLEWDPACLAFHETKRPIRTASVVQVRQPIYTRSVERWRNYEEALRPLLDQV